MMKQVLTIAGSDCSGGAGIAADLKTMTAHKLYGMCVITALTAQNTTGVYGVMEASPEFVALQLDCVFQDIRPDAVKIGMVSNSRIIETIACKLKEYHAENIVVDPVMVSTSGSKLLGDEAMHALLTRLLPLADIITPNIPEAETLCGRRMETHAEIEAGARKIAEITGGGILIKGGHLPSCADDLFYDHGKACWFHSPKEDTPNTHGTGCTLSSAIACNLAAGYSMYESIKNAKAYVTSALQSGLDLGAGPGPLNHMCSLS